MLTNLPIYPRFLADSILFDPQFLQCCVAAMGTSLIWVSLHALSHYMVVRTLFQWIISILLWLLEVLSLSLDLLLGEGVSKKALSVTREFLFNQSMQMFLYSIRMIRYCCPLSCFPQVCRWIYIVDSRISHEFVAGFIYHFLNIGTFFCGYLYIALWKVFRSWDKCTELTDQEHQE